MSADSTIVYECVNDKGLGWRAFGRNMPAEAVLSQERLNKFNRMAYGASIAEGTGDSGERLVEFEFNNGRWIYKLEALGNRFFRATLVKGKPLYALETQVE